MENRRAGTTVKFTGHANTIRSIQVIESKKLIISAGNDRKLIFWDYEAKLQIDSFPNLHKGHIIALAVSSDSSFVVSGSYDGSLKIFSIGLKNTIKFVKKLNFTNRVYSIGISSDNSNLFCGGYNKKFFRRWESFNEMDDGQLQMIQEEHMIQEADDLQKEPFVSTLLSKVFDTRAPSEMDQLYLSQHIGDFKASKIQSDEGLNSSLINVSVNEGADSANEESENKFKKEKPVLERYQRKLFLSQIITEPKKGKPEKYKHADIKQLLKPIEKTFGLKMRESQIGKSSANPVKRAHERSQINSDQHKIVSTGVSRILGKLNESQDFGNNINSDSVLEKALDSDLTFLKEIKEKVKKVKIQSEEFEECEQIRKDLRSLLIDIQVRESKVIKSKLTTLKSQRELKKKLEDERKGRSVCKLKDEESSSVMIPKDELNQMKKELEIFVLKKKNSDEDFDDFDNLIKRFKKFE